MMSTAEAALLAKYRLTEDDLPASLARNLLIDELRLRDSLDPHFARISLVDFKLAATRRTVLDARTQILVGIGQFTCAQASGHLAAAIRAGVEAGVPPAQMLESIVQCHIYAGEVTVQPALRIFAEIITAAGLLDELANGQLPVEGTEGIRGLDQERVAWPDDAAADPRLPALLEKYGWLGISRGLQYKATAHLNILEYRDAIDPEWTRFWLEFAYRGLYSRFVLDERTRLLCVVGDCIALGAVLQAREHMEGALKAGATFAEITEVVQASAVYFGFPKMGAGLRVVVALATDLGRLDEMGNPPADPQVRK
jgi:alkylhydroperoxidase/carboxymuconolactone decarboxylase family protein YurZ